VQEAHVVPSVQVLQELSQTKHLPLLRYLPSIHPGTQVVPVIKNPSLHVTHWDTFEPKHVEQAGLHFEHTLTELA
jgi:hypothetical protein